jgi:hypothetical protein
MKFNFQIPNIYVRLGDFTGLTRYGYPFGGPSPDELSPEMTVKVNSRWEEFYTTAYPQLMLIIQFRHGTHRNAKRR